MFLAWLKPFYSEDDGAPQGGGADDGKNRPTDVLDRYGRDALKLAERLSDALNDNYSLREKNRALRADKSALEKTQAPEGSIVLTKEQAAQWEAYTALGEPQALKSTLEQATTATEEAARLRRTETIRAAAEAHGYKAAALGKLPSLHEKAIELRDVQEDGKTVKRAFVDGTPIQDYIQANDPELMGALKDTTPAPLGTAFLSQGGANDQASGDLAARHIAQQEARRATEKNPLMRG